MLTRTITGSKNCPILNHTNKSENVNNDKPAKHYNFQNEK